MIVYKTIQVLLIGAKPIVQVKRMRQEEYTVDHENESGFAMEQKFNKNKTAKGAAHRGTHTPPGQAPRYTGPRKTHKTHPKVDRPVRRKVLTFT